VPFNQASFQDHEALVDWLFRAETEQSGATARVLKPALRPDFLVPFAAMKDWGTLDQLGAQAEAGLRAMVLGTERLIGLIASRLLALGETGTRCHVLLPLSPNHGAFGGDGAYAESKAALEVLLAKWHSEQAAWARATTIVGARIGWVRGTGLMAHNDALAPQLEAATGIKTFSQDEMGQLLAELLDTPTRLQALAAPVVADLTGGFAKVADLKGAVDRIREALAHAEKTDRAVGALSDAERVLLAGESRADSGTVTPLAGWPTGRWPGPRRRRASRIWSSSSASAS
jgi:fatty acid synthase